VSLELRALGTTVVLALAKGEGLVPARVALERELALVDETCSRFRSDSELVRLNRLSGRPVPVSQYLYDALGAARDAAAGTAGLVDPTVGRQLRLAGYDATFELVRRRDGAAFRPRFEAAAGWEALELDEGRRTVCVPVGVELDLGATAKALAADRAARAAAAAAGCGALVSLGGDVAVSGEPPGNGWAVGVADDHAGRAEETVAIVAGGVATSSTTVRRWRGGDVELHHILDPRTGRPAATRWRTATVAAGSCLDANVAATAAILLGDEAPEWLASRGLPARLVSRTGSVARVAAWPRAA
jgi:thiamine biosynthesis lipoprotein